MATPLPDGRLDFAASSPPNQFDLKESVKYVACFEIFATINVGHSAGVSRRNFRRNKVQSGPPVEIFGTLTIPDLKSKAQ